MPTIDGAALKDLLSTPLVLGALAAPLVVLVVLAVMRAGVARRLLLPVAMLAIVSFAVMAILDRMAQNERAAERRALAQRYAELSAQALAPGSTLACLDGAAGDTVENGCEKTVFAGPQSTASAVACEGVFLSGPEFCLERHSLVFLVRPMPVPSTWQCSLRIFGVL